MPFFRSQDMDSEWPGDIVIYKFKEQRMKENIKEMDQQVRVTGELVGELVIIDTVLF